MNNHEVDIDKIYQAGEDITKLVNECTLILSDLKKRISAVPTETKEWQGNASLKFSSIFLDDIQEYEKAIKTIAAFGNQLKNDASRYQETLKRVIL